jgi:hypothetical protein
MVEMHTELWSHIPLGRHGRRWKDNIKMDLKEGVFIMWAN